MRARKTAVTIGFGAVAVAATFATCAPAGATPTPQPGVTIGASSDRAGDASPAERTGGTSTYLEKNDSMETNDALVSTGLENPGTQITTSYFGTRLVLQGDGNLVEYVTTTGAAIWSTNTAGSSATHLEFQDDGNLVLYTATNTAVWSSGTYGTTAQYFYLPGDGTAVVQDNAGHYLVVEGPAIAGPAGQIYAHGQSADARYKLVVQDDGNVVAYDTTTGQPYWSTGTNGAGRVLLLTQGDGNIVLYRASTGRAIWSSGTADDYTGYTQLDIQTDGNVVLYDVNGGQRAEAIWQSGNVR